MSPVEHNDDGKPVWIRRSRRQAMTHWLTTLGVAAVILWCFKLIADDTTWEFVWSAPEQGADLGTRMFFPEWFVDIPQLHEDGQLGSHIVEFFGQRAAYALELWSPLIDTIHIATLGTVLGVMIASPLAFLAARNTTPSERFVRPVALMILVTSRSVNSLIWALLLVFILGPGMLAGILAIALRSVGFCGKLLYESIEEIDESTRAAVASTGAGPLQVLSFGVIPQIAPAFAGISIYRWDINIREATILGLVGAGGIGVALQDSIDTLAWGQVSVIFMAILGTVILSEWISAKARGAVT